LGLTAECTRAGNRFSRRRFIGLNKRGKLTCIPPPCVPPPPGTVFYYLAQDCSQLALASQAAVHCVNQLCLTYYACNDCMR
jgi:hypothetical protein